MASSFQLGSVGLDTFYLTFIIILGGRYDYPYFIDEEAVSGLKVVVTYKRRAWNESFIFSFCRTSLNLIY